MSKSPILQVKNLVTTFETELGSVKAVNGVSFNLQKGKTLGIVGESGCGKSVTALSIMRLLPQPAGKIASGEIVFDGIDLTTETPKAMRSIRGKRISMIFQEPMTALNPVHRIAKQLAEPYSLHHPEMTSQEILNASISILQKVGISAPEQRIKDYSHQLSGGMRQRVMIAMALACNPEIIIADEPTTALDVTIQAQILALMKSLQAETGMAIIFITHDLGVIAETCEDVAVMYAGNVVEKAPVIELFKNPRHPYTIGLLKSMPRLTHPPKQKLYTIEGVVPDLYHLPSGCRFQNRCPHKILKCEQKQPAAELANSEHLVSCHRWKEIHQ